VSTCAGPQTK